MIRKTQSLLLVICLFVSTTQTSFAWTNREKEKCFIASFPIAAVVGILGAMGLGFSVPDNRWNSEISCPEGSYPLCCTDTYNNGTVESHSDCIVLPSSSSQCSDEQTFYCAQGETYASPDTTSADWRLPVKATSSVAVILGFGYLISISIATIVLKCQDLISPVSN
jgi:hypothetical protein